MRSPITVWICSAIAGVAALGVGCKRSPASAPAVEETQPIAHLELRTGTVKLERDHRRTVAELGYIYLKDAFETGAFSGMKIRFPGAGTVEVGSESQLAIGGQKDNLVVSAGRGSFLLISPAPSNAPKGEGQLTLQTPFGRVRSRTSGKVSAQLLSTLVRIQVSAGAADLEDNQGGRITAVAGQQFTLSPEGLRAAIWNDSAAASEESLVSSTTKAIGGAGPPTVVKGTAGAAEPASKSSPPSSDHLAWRGEGRAEVRLKRSQSWTRLNGRSPKLAVGDALRILEGSIASELSDGVRLSARAGTEFVFEGLDRDTGDPSLSLPKGELSVSLLQEKPRKLVISGIALSAEGPGYFGVRKTAEGWELTSLAGDLEFRKAALQGKVSAGQSATIQEQRAVLRDLERADLVLPTRPGLKVYERGLDWVTLAWEGGKRDYLVELAFTADWEEPILRGRVRRPFLNFPAPNHGWLHWRVLEPNKEVMARGSALFSPEPTREVSKVRNEVPEREKTTIFYSDRTPGITFTFQPEPNASKYRVSLYRAPEAGRPIFERLVPQSSMSIEPGFLSEGSYLWQVTPIAVNGAELPGRRMNKLDLVFDNSESTLVVRSPRNGEPLKGSRVLVAGVAPLGSKVLVNGKPAPLDDKNRFELAVAPTGRSPMAIFRLVRPSEPDLFVVRSLRRGR